jgi:hypothetical protein
MIHLTYRHEETTPMHRRCKSGSTGMEQRTSCRPDAIHRMYSVGCPRVGRGDGSYIVPVRQMKRAINQNGRIKVHSNGHEQTYCCRIKNTPGYAISLTTACNMNACHFPPNMRRRTSRTRPSSPPSPLMRTGHPNAAENATK